MRKDLSIGFEAESILEDHLRSLGFNITKSERYDTDKDFIIQDNEGKKHSLELKFEVMYVSKPGKGFSVPAKPTQQNKFLIKAKYYMFMQAPIVWEDWSVKRNRLDHDDMHAIKLWLAPPLGKRRLGEYIKGYTPKDDRFYVPRDAVPGFQAMRLFDTIRDEDSVEFLRRRHLETHALPKGAKRS